ncbi:MAG TPA: hypothetical protein VF043_20550 [Ktedonobacteraceae bacterium]
MESQKQSDIDHWKTVHQEIRRSYDFLVQNLNNQQQRVANVLITNGLILGFLGASAPVFIGVPGSSLYLHLASVLYLLAICCLALGVVTAVFALRPQVDPSGGSVPPQPGKVKADFILHPGEILEEGLQNDDAQLLRKLSESIVSNVAASRHIEVIQSRRKYINYQLIIISVGVLLLVVALILRLLAT